MLKHLYPLLLLAMAGQAQAEVRSVAPIPDGQGCPGLGQNHNIQTIIPHVSTKLDDLGERLDLMLMVKDWNPPSHSLTNWLRICAVSTSGAFLGGSMVVFTQGSRVKIQRSTGTEALSLEELVAATTPDLGDRTFQLYLEVGNNNTHPPQVEFSQSGNRGQYFVSAAAPNGAERWILMNGGDPAPFESTVHVANPGGSDNCSLTLTYLGDDGQPISTSSEAVLAHGSISLRPAPLGGLPFSGVVIERQSGCGAMYAMRVIDYPSNALGGHTAVMISR